jgi:hypothetical protein
MFNLGDVITHVPSLLPQLLCRGTHIMCVGMPIYVGCRWKQSQRFSVWYFCFYFREVKTQLNHSRSLAACVRMSCSMRAQKDRERKGIRVQDKTTRSECLVDMHSDAKYPVATATTITFTFWNCRILFLLSVKLAKVLQLAQSLHICSLNVKFRCVSWRSSCLKLRWYVPAEAAVLDRCLLFGGRFHFSPRFHDRVCGDSGSCFRGRAAALRGGRDSRRSGSAGHRSDLPGLGPPLEGRRFFGVHEGSGEFVSFLLRSRVRSLL